MDERLQAKPYPRLADGESSPGGQGGFLGARAYCLLLKCLFFFFPFCQSNEMDFLDTSISWAKKEGAAASCHLNLH